MAEGMIEEFYRYLVEEKKAEGEDKAAAYEDKQMEDYHFCRGVEGALDMILVEFKKRFSL